MNMRSEQIPTVILAAIMAAMFVAAIALPFVNPYGSLIGLDGNAGNIDHSDIWRGLDPVSAFFYYLGDILCHQEESRTFILNENQMYICIRDFSLLTGFLAGCITSLMSWDRVKDLDLKRSLFYLALIAITPVEWCIERYTDLDIPAVRSITGIVTGFAIAIVLTILIKREMSADNPKSQ